MSKKIAVALAFVATVGSATDATACNDGGCGHPATPTTPGLTVNTTNNTTNNNPTANANNHIGIKNENEISNHVAGGQGGSANNTNTVTTTGTVGNVAGGQATSATTNSGNSTNTNNYSSKYKGSAIAPNVYAPGNTGHDCFEGKGGFSLSLGTYGASAGVGFGGGEKFNTTCDDRLKENILMQQNETAAEKARNTLIGAEKSEAVANAVQRLQGDEGTKLMKLFAVPAVVTTAQPAQPIVNNYITTDRAVQPQALKMGE